MAGILSYQITSSGFQAKGVFCPLCHQASGQAQPQRQNSPCGQTRPKLVLQALSRTERDKREVKEEGDRARYIFIIIRLISTSMHPLRPCPSPAPGGPAGVPGPHSPSDAAQPSTERSGPEQSGSGASSARGTARRRGPAPGGRAVFWETGLVRILLDLQRGLPKWCVPGRPGGCTGGVCPIR